MSYKSKIYGIVGALAVLVLVFTGAYIHDLRVQIETKQSELDKISLEREILARNLDLQNAKIKELELKGEYEKPKEALKKLDKITPKGSDCQSELYAYKMLFNSF